MNFDGVTQSSAASAAGEKSVAEMVAALRHELEQSRHKSERIQERLVQMEGLFAHVADAFLVVECDGQIIDVNPAATALLGYSRKEFLTMHPWDFVTSVSREEILAVIDNLKGGAPLSVQRVCRSKSGEEKIMALRLRRNDFCGRDLIVVTGRDVTQEQRASVGLEKALKEIKRSEIEIRAIVDALPAQAWCSREDGYNIFCNQQWLDYSGFTQETARGWSYRDTIHPDDIGPYVKKWTEVSATGASIDAEARFRRFDGEYRWFLIRAVPVRDENGDIIKWFGTNTDIDDRKKAEALLAGENKILEMVATGKSLTVILEELCRMVDEISPDSMASVLLVDSSDCLRTGAAPRFPKDFIALIDGIKIGPTVGSCGTAAYRKEQVIVTDIETDPLWKDYRELAKQYDLRAGWSTPILSSDRRVLGVFGVYWNTPQRPSPSHLYVIDQITHLASVAIERERASEALRASEELARGQTNVLTRTLDEITRESDFDRIAEHVLRALTSQLDAFSCGVWLRNATSGMMDFEFALEGERLKSKSDPVLAAVSPSLPMNGVYPWPEIFRTGRPVSYEDIREGADFPWRAHLLKQGIITVLVVPMFIAGEPSGVIGIRFNQKRKFRAEEMELAKALANQAMLAMQLSRLSEKSRRSAVMAERNRMAREVHDTLAQSFTGVILHMEAAEEAMSRQRTEVVSGHLRSAGEIARDGLREARRSVQALRPLALEQKKLAEALEELLAKQTAGTAVQGKFILQGEPRELAPEWEANILRIGQEVLTNALRHAQATEFGMTLIFSDREICLSMRDNGCGFDPAGKYSGFGLRGMAERTEDMGGQFTIQSAQGQGTAISVAVPLPIFTGQEKL